MSSNTAKVCSVVLDLQRSGVSRDVSLSLMICLLLLLKLVWGVTFSTRSHMHGLSMTSREEVLPFEYVGGLRKKEEFDLLRLTSCSSANFCFRNGQQNWGVIYTRIMNIFCTFDEKRIVNRNREACCTRWMHTLDALEEIITLPMVCPTTKPVQGWLDLGASRTLKDCPRSAFSLVQVMPLSGADLTLLAPHTRSNSS